MKPPSKKGKRKPGARYGIPPEVETDTQSQTVPGKARYRGKSKKPMTRAELRREKNKASKARPSLPPFLQQ